MKSPHLSAGLGALGVAALAVGLVSAPDEAEACQPDPYIASICITAITYCPDGYYELAGGIIPINQDTALYSLIGPTFGGDGRVTFAVPDLRGRELVGSGLGPGLTQLIRGWYIGFEKELMTMFHTPQHTHTIDLSAATHTSNMRAVSGASNSTDPTGSSYSQSQASTAYATSSDTTMGPAAFEATAVTSVGVTGDTPPSGTALEPFNILGPQLGLRMCIAWDGLYPPRPN